jgi:hypothetical protein
MHEIFCRVILIYQKLNKINLYLHIYDEVCHNKHEDRLLIQWKKC